MNGTWRCVLPLLALAAAAGMARAGVDADLTFPRITENRVPSLGIEGGKALSVAGETRVLMVRRADPEELQAGEAVSAPKQAGDAAPLWLLVGEDAKQVALLAAAAEVKSPPARKIGGIGTCTVYTPCRKCAAWAADLRSRRTMHPPALRIREVPLSEVQRGQLLMPDPQLTGGTPIVLEDERTGVVVNEIRRVAFRAKMGR